MEGKCNAGNIGSARVMEKLGMSYEGLLRKQLKIKGVFTDQKCTPVSRMIYNTSNDT
ncbi:GNAT family protein [Paenibacillus amylolyticus]|nr:GNAT family protein [Paenibacillus amylolyticus]